MLEYKGITCIAVSTVTNLTFYKVEDLSPMKEPYIDELDRIIKEIHLSPCGRILVVCEEYILSAWDLQH